MNLAECKEVLMEPYDNILATILGAENVAMELTYAQHYLGRPDLDCLDEFDAEYYKESDNAGLVFGAYFMCTLRERMYRAAMRKNVGNRLANAWFFAYYEYTAMILFERYHELKNGKPRKKAKHWLN